MSINNMLLLLDFARSNLNFEPSIVEIHQVLKEVWLFEHEFQARKFDQLQILRVSNLSTICSLELLKDEDSCCTNPSLSNA